MTSAPPSSASPSAPHSSITTRSLPEPAMSNVPMAGGGMYTESKTGGNDEIQSGSRSVILLSARPYSWDTHAYADQGTVERLIKDRLEGTNTNHTLLTGPRDARYIELLKENFNDHFDKYSGDSTLIILDEGGQNAGVASHDGTGHWVSLGWDNLDTKAIIQSYVDAAKAGHSSEGPKTDVCLWTQSTPNPKDLSEPLGEDGNLMDLGCDEVRQAINIHLINSLKALSGEQSDWSAQGQMSNYLLHGIKNKMSDDPTLTFEGEEYRPQQLLESRMGLPWTQDERREALDAWKGMIDESTLSTVMEKMSNKLVPNAAEWGLAMALALKFPPRDEDGSLSRTKTGAADAWGTF